MHAAREEGGKDVSRHSSKCCMRVNGARTQPTIEKSGYAFYSWTEGVKFKKQRMERTFPIVGAQCNTDKQLCLLLKSLINEVEELSESKTCKQLLVFKSDMPRSQHIAKIVSSHSSNF